MSSYTSGQPDKEKTVATSSHTAPTKTSTTVKAASLAKSKKNDDKDRKKKEQEEKDAAEVEPWWPPFNFDGRNALKSRICINLRNCQYELFRNIALQELGWRVVDHRNRVVDNDILKLEELEREQQEAARAADSGKHSQRSGTGNDDQDDKYSDGNKND